MNEYYIKCNNLKETEFAINYFVNKGYILPIYIHNITNSLIANNDTVDCPIIVHTVHTPANVFIEWCHLDKLTKGTIIKEAKYLMREKKFNKIFKNV